MVARPTFGDKGIAPPRDYGHYTVIDCRNWQRLWWREEKEKQQREAWKRKREKSFEARREWCKRLRERMADKRAGKPILPIYDEAQPQR